jgi:hypothetical protein
LWRICGSVVKLSRRSRNRDELKLDWNRYAPPLGARLSLASTSTFTGVVIDNFGTIESMGNGTRVIRGRGGVMIVW